MTNMKSSSIIKSSSNHPFIFRPWDSTPVNTPDINCDGKLDGELKSIKAEANNGGTVKNPQSSMKNVSSSMMTFSPSVLMNYPPQPSFVDYLNHNPFISGANFFPSTTNNPIGHYGSIPLNYLPPSMITTTTTTATKSALVSDLNLAMKMIQQNSSTGKNPESKHNPNKKQRPKRFQCPHCQVSFSNNGQLRGHIRIHTGERPFICDHENCGKTFTRNEELTRHKRIHTGLRPFACSICNKRFGRKDHLKKHVKTHQRPPSMPIPLAPYPPFGPFPWI